MSSPTEPPEECLRRENFMGVRKGVSAARWTHLTPRPKCPEKLDARCPRQRLIEEVRLVDVDQLGPGKHSDDAPERQEDAERDRLLATRGALAREYEHSHDAAGQEGRQQRRDDR